MEVALAHKGFDTGDVLHKVLITYQAGFLQSLKEEA
jgi:hypothetical protein